MNIFHTILLIQGDQGESPDPIPVEDAVLYDDGANLLYDDQVNVLYD